MTVKIQVDRIEGNVVVLLDGDKNIYDIPKGFFAQEPNEGDIFEVDFEDGKPVRSLFLEEETEAVKRRIRELMAKMRKKK